LERDLGIQTAMSHHLPMNTASRGVLPHVSSKSALLLFAGSKMARKADRRASSELAKVLKLLLAVFFIGSLPTDSEKVTLIHFLTFGFLWIN
jgi:hypothetical protein